MTVEKDLPTIFHKIITDYIDEKGVYPHQCIWLDQNDKICIAAMDLLPDQVYYHVESVLLLEKPKELIFGLDRSTKEGQGTEFADVLVAIHFKNGKYKVGVINYQFEPTKIVRDWDWDNEFWNNAVEKELSQKIMGTSFLTSTKFSKG